MDQRKRRGIYIASKVKHAHNWRVLRDAHGYPIISTWIDEAGVGETKSFSELWQRIVREVSGAAALIVYAADEQEILKGALVEVGIALASNVPVIAVGPMPGTFHNHPLVTKVDTIVDAYFKATQIIVSD